MAQSQADTATCQEHYMPATPFAARLRQGELLIGPIVSLPCADVAAALARCGFDWLFLDAEHGPFNPQQALPLLHAAGDFPCIVRVPAGNDYWIGKALDSGAAGIMVPKVGSAVQAREIVARAKYAPQGQRGMGLGRAHGYGTDPGYVQRANAETVVVVQAETKEAVDNINDIAAVPGVDAVLIGPNDLAASLGVPGQLDAPVVLDAIETIVAACKARKMPIGYFGVSAEAVKPLIHKGATLIAMGVDVLFMINAAKQQLAALKRQAGS
jgi:2-dehydro-3-deoxyglucarate aldolase